MRSARERRSKERSIPLPAAKRTMDAPVRLGIAGQARLLLVDKPAATQTYFYIAQPGIDANRPGSRAGLPLSNTCLAAVSRRC